MRVITIFTTAVLLTACQISVAKTDPVTIAHEYVGLQERQDRSTIRELVGVDPVRTEWCAAFVNAILELDGIPGSNSVSDNPLMARSFLSWGTKVEKENIQRGDIVVFPRGNQGWQGHVGFFVTEENGEWLILGGNQDNTVSYRFYNPRNALGIRRAPAINTTVQ